MAVNGLGFAEDPEDLQENLTPTAPELDVLGAPTGQQPESRREPPLIDVNSNPLGAIGAVMLNVARGARGQKLFTDEMRERRAEQDRIELQRAQVGSQAMSRGLKLLENTPAEERPRVIQQYGEMFEGVLPGFTETFAAAARSPDVSQKHAEALGEHGPVLISMYGSIEGAASALKDGDLMKRLDEAADLRNLPEITEAFDRIKTTLDKSPAGQEFLSRAAEDGWTVSDLANPEILEAFGLEETHLRSIMRNPNIQSNLRPFGFIPTSDLDAQAGEKSPDRIGAEAAATKAAQEGEKIIPFENRETGEIRREPQRLRDQMRADGFEPLETGRTPDDAATRAERKREAGDAGPISPFVSSVLQLPPETTIGEFRANGGNPEIPETDIRELQTLEAGFKNANDTIERIKSLVDENPDLNAAGGRLASVVSNLRQHVTSVGRALGAPITENLDAEIERVMPDITEQGIQNAELQSLVIDLAYMAAVSRGQTGRGLSDNDVKRFSKVIGESQADPDQLKAVLDSQIVRFDQSFRNKFESVVRQRPPSGLPDVRQAEQLVENMDGMSKAEATQAVSALTPRAKRELRLLLKQGQ